MHAFILAGGFATRLWPLTEKRAKPLLPVAGKPLLTHIVERLPDMPITASTNAAFAESTEEWAKTVNRPVTVVAERTRSDDDKLGALGALAQWLRDAEPQDDILLLAGDNYLGFTMHEFLSRYTPGVPLLAVREIGDRKKAQAFGTVIVQEDGKTIALYEEKPAVAKSSLVSTTCAVLPPSVFPVIQECAVTHPDKNGVIWEQFLARGIRSEAFAFTEPWYDIGSFQSYLEASRHLSGGRILRDATATLESTECRNMAVIGRNSVVRKSALHDVVVFEDCVIEDCVLQDCVIDDRCELRGVDLTGKMIRAGTKLVRET